MAKEILSAPRAGSLVMMGGSAGSLDVILRTLRNLRAPFTAALCIVVHRNTDYESALSALAQSSSTMHVRDVEDKMPVEPGTLYIAPADYHLLCEHDRTWSLDVSEKINHSRPSIDVAFESAAEVYGPCLMCVLLSGANADGAAGLAMAKALGSATVVQDPAEASVSVMPLAGLRSVPDVQVCSVDSLPDVINQFALAAG